MDVCVEVCELAMLKNEVEVVGGAVDEVAADGDVDVVGADGKGGDALVLVEVGVEFEWFGAVVDGGDVGIEKWQQLKSLLNKGKINQKTV